MAFFDFFRRRKDREGVPQRSGGVRGFFSRLFNRKKPAPAPAPEPLPDLAAMEEPDIEIGDLFETVEPVYTSDQEIPTVPTTDIAQVTPVSDSTLLIRYRKMLDTMINKGYIEDFDSEEDAAEFLRVLSSQAWQEAHTYWYSVEALQQIQDAIQRGATAGSLQDEYNKQIEKKSKNYLRTWEEWLRVED